jgi:zeaxanthin glucosyltransferase
MATTEHPKRLIAIAVLPEWSSYNASFMLAHALTENGFAVLYIGTQNFMAHVAAQGFDFVPLSIPESSDSPINSGGPLSRWRQRRAALQAILDRHHDILRQLEDIIRERSPALLLMDPIVSSSYSAPFLKCGIPIISLNHTLASTFSTKYPPVFCGTIPKAGASKLQQVRFVWDWIACIGWRWLRLHLRIEYILTLLFFGLIHAWLNRPEALIKRFGGRLRFGEFGYRLVAPEFVTAPKEFDFVEVSEATNRFYIGSCVAEARRDEPLEIADLSDTKPLLYCSLGTYNKAYLHAKRLFKVVIAALTELPDWHAIIQVGDAAPIDEFGQVRQGIHVVKVVPQLQVLQHADVFITHGGFSSVRESIYFGVPMLVLPCWLDQPGNAARVVRHGLGLRADIATVSPNEVRESIIELAKPDRRAKVAILQQVFIRQKCCASVIPQIETYLHLRRPF